MWAEVKCVHVCLSHCFLGEGSEEETGCVPV